MATGEQPGFDAVYAQLRSLAAAMTRGGGEAVLRPTDLAHRAWEKLGPHGFESERHYRAVAALAMRQILADHARRARTGKRRGERVTLTDRLGTDGPSIDLVDLHHALEDLERLDPRGHRIVVLRYMGGLTTDEVAEYLGVSRRTVLSSWKLSRVWLMDRLG
jgi:RNA polymerase sigma factor (TIGR02999 family)